VTYDMTSEDYRNRSHLEIEFEQLLFANGFPPHVTEHRFSTVRRWRFDFAWPRHRIAVEIEGGVWTGGRHTRPEGYTGDLEKYNAAAEAGWAVYRFTTSMIRDQSEKGAIATLKRVFEKRRIPLLEPA
jgi:very-short-patch-repair endonuclease